MGVFEVCKSPYPDPRQDDQIDKYYSNPEKPWFLVKFPILGPIIQNINFNFF